MKLNEIVFLTIVTGLTAGLGFTFSIGTGLLTLFAGFFMGSSLALAQRK